MRIMRARCVEKFAGSCVAIVTPMTDGGRIDTDAYRALLAWHIAEGSDSIVVAGTTGESPTLSMDEHHAIIKQTVGEVAGRVPVIAGVGANATAEAVALTQRAAADGADAGLSVVPYYNRPTQAGLVAHFTQVANATDMPIILYDVPGRCVVGLDDATVVQLAQACSNIIGIKDATGDVARVARLQAMLDAAGVRDFLLLSGDDKTACDFVLAGGHGVISVTANIAPRRMRAMVAAARAADADAARQLDAPMHAFHCEQAAEANPIPVKAALAAMGKIQNHLRLPLLPLSAAYHAQVQAAASAATTAV